MATEAATVGQVVATEAGRLAAVMAGTMMGSAGTMMGSAGVTVGSAGTMMGSAGVTVGSADSVGPSVGAMGAVGDPRVMALFASR